MRDLIPFANPCAACTPIVNSCEPRLPNALTMLDTAVLTIPMTAAKPLLKAFLTPCISPCTNALIAFITVDTTVLMILNCVLNTLDNKPRPADTTDLIALIALDTAFLIPFHALDTVLDTALMEDDTMPFSPFHTLDTVDDIADMALLTPLPITLNSFFISCPALRNQSAMLWTASPTESLTLFHISVAFALTVSQFW